MSSTLLDAVTAELEKFLAPVLDGIEDPFYLDRLLFQLGTSTGDVGDTQPVAAFTAIGNLKQQIESLAAAPEPSFSGITNCLEAVRSVFAAFRALSSPGGPASAFATLGEDTVQLLFGIYLSQSYPLLYSIGVLLTLIDSLDKTELTTSVSVGGKLVRRPVALPRFHPDRLVKLFDDPIGLLRAEYVNALATVDDANSMADRLFGRLSYLLSALGVRWLYGFDAQTAALMGSAAPISDHALVVYFQTALSDAVADAGVSLFLSPVARGDLGLVVCPFGTLTLSEKLGNWALTGSVSAEVQAFAFGHHGTQIAASAGIAQVDTSFTATLAAPSKSDPAFVLGSKDGSRLEVGGATLKILIALAKSHQTFSMSADIEKAAIVIASGDGDGFLSKVLPANGLRADFDLGIAWSNTAGFSFRGAASLDATISVGISLGGTLTIPTIHLRLQAGDAGLVVEVSAGIGLSIGPVQALVDRVGLSTNLSFPKTGGNLGIADVSFAFKQPSGVGLSIDAAGVNGGGFLAHPDGKHEYAGVLQLQFNDLALQAFGLITTQVAGGSGYSLIALVDADFPPVQLGWGFTLNGVGGLLAMHRTADKDALRAALKADKLSTILFPKNAITNAPQVLAQLDAMFPTAQGRFLFGPMALIGWGAEGILKVALAVILELPEPVRIILIARLAVRLPSESNALVRINLDALGVLDLSQSEFSLDATLYDSKLLGYTLTGDMALRANWGGTQREFLLAIGGFHPQFTPPPGFPPLQRITIDMPGGSIAKLRLAAYLAVTSNTVQFGATLDVYIGVSEFGLKGHLGFDALLQLHPFHFEADISASIALMAGGDNLMSVGLDATLSGPAPWNIAGKFKIDLFFFTVHKSFSYTWGDGTPAESIPVIDVLPLLTAALANSRNWGTQPPANVPALVSSRSQDGSTLVAHPLAQLQVHQSVVPLDLQIEHFGTAAISGATTFTISDCQVNGVTVSKQATAVQDDFAPAQFFNLSETEKLAGPSFEQHNAGLRLGIASAVSATPALPKAITYKTFYIDQPGGGLRPDSGVTQTGLFTLDLALVVRYGAAGRAQLRTAGNLRFKAPGKPVSVTAPQFTVASTATLASAGLGPSTGLTYTGAKALRAQAITKNPSFAAQLQIVATHEMTVS